jgi:hypothetical protein
MNIVELYEAAGLACAGAALIPIGFKIKKKPGGGYLATCFSLLVGAKPLRHC